MVERELAGVTHLVSTVEGTLREDVGLAELLAATFPGGSVTGAPKIAAVDLIAELEPVGRGASMGALGVVRGNGDLELALTIRTFAIADGRIHLWVGGGIVWDSDPEAEIEESWTKAAPAADRDRRPDRGGGAVSLLAVAVGGRGVVDPAEPVLRADDEALLRGRGAFETIRVYAGASFRLPEHLERLARSAERIGLPPVNVLQLRELAAQAIEAAGEPDAVLRLIWTPGNGDGDPTALALVSALAGPLRRAARARPAADLPARRARRRAVAPPGSEVDELRRQHGRRGRGQAPRRRRRRLRRRRRDRARRARRRTSGGVAAAPSTRRRSTSASSPA